MSNNNYTVVIPAFNAEKYIAECLQSVLSQTTPPQQIIVVDDGSVDATAQIARSASSTVKVISTPNRVAFVDSDDVWLPQKMEIQLASLNDSALACDAVTTKMRAFGDIHLKNINEEYSSWSRSTLVIWMQAFRKVGDVRDLGHGYGEMVDWFSRAKHAGLNIKLVDEALALRRIHSESVSFKANAGQAQDYLRAAVLAFQRKKQLN